MEPTIDADIVIVARTVTPPVVRYRRLSDGVEWSVVGNCNQCGLCVVGAVGDWYEWDGPAGTPNASRDTRWPDRLDDPVTPGFFEDMEQMAQAVPTATVSGCSMTLASES